MRRARSPIFFFGVAVFFCVSLPSSYADHRSWENDSVTVSDVFRHIEERYLHQLDTNVCRNTMLREARSRSAQSGHGPYGSIDFSESCLYSMLDKYSFVETVKARKEQSIQMGDVPYGGVGMGIGVKLPGKRVQVNSVFPNSGAEEAGIKRGDFIVRVRDERETEFTQAEDLHVVVDKLRGPPGTRVVVEIERGGAVFSLTIMRKQVFVATVFPQKIGPDIGYIRVRTFGLNTADDFENALLQMDPSKLKGLIIDLRDNSGGNLIAATEMLYYFSKNPDDIMFAHRSRFGTEWQDVFYTIKEPLGGVCEQELLVGMYCPTFVVPQTGVTKVPGRFANLRVVVLVNKFSASASEIFSGALKDWGSQNGMFTIVGTTSFGKGIGQTIIPLDSLSSNSNKFYLHYTSFEFLVGNRGTSIHGVGVVPDVVVEDAEVDREPQSVYNGDVLDLEHDTQLKKALAILR